MYTPELDPHLAASQAVSQDTRYRDRTLSHKEIQKIQDLLQRHTENERYQPLVLRTDSQINKKIIRALRQIDGSESLISDVQQFFKIGKSGLDDTQIINVSQALLPYTHIEAGRSIGLTDTQIKLLSESLRDLDPVNLLTGQHMTLLKEFMMMQTGISSAELNFRSQMFLVDPDGAALNRLIDELEQKGYWSQTMDNEKIASRLLKYVQRTIDYRSDQEGPQPHRDYWQSVDETLGSLTGDCEDQSILLASMLMNVMRRKGMSERDIRNKVRLSAGYMGGSDRSIGHMMVRFTTDRDDLYLDATSTHDIRSVELVDFDTVFEFNDVLFERHQEITDAFTTALKVTGLKDGASLMSRINKMVVELNKFLKADIKLPHNTGTVLKRSKGGATIRSDTAKGEFSFFRVKYKSYMPNPLPNLGPISAFIGSLFSFVGASEIKTYHIEMDKDAFSDYLNKSRDMINTITMMFHLGNSYLHAINQASRDLFDQGLTNDEKRIVEANRRSTDKQMSKFVGLMNKFQQKQGQAVQDLCQQLFTYVQSTNDQFYSEGKYAANLWYRGNPASGMLFAVLDEAVGFFDLDRTTALSKLSLDKSKVDQHNLNLFVDFAADMGERIDFWKIRKGVHTNTSLRNRIEYWGESFVDMMDSNGGNVLTDLRKNLVMKFTKNLKMDISFGSSIDTWNGYRTLSGKMGNIASAASYGRSGLGVGNGSYVTPSGGARQFLDLNYEQTLQLKDYTNKYQNLVRLTYMIKTTLWEHKRKIALEIAEKNDAGDDTPSIGQSQGFIDGAINTELQKQSMFQEQAVQQLSQFVSTYNDYAKELGEVYKAQAKMVAKLVRSFVNYYGGPLAGTLAGTQAAATAAFIAVMPPNWIILPVPPFVIVVPGMITGSIAGVLSAVYDFFSNTTEQLVEAIGALALAGLELGIDRATKNFNTPDFLQTLRVADDGGVNLNNNKGQYEELDKLTKDVPDLSKLFSESHRQFFGNVAERDLIKPRTYFDGTSSERDSYFLGGRSPSSLGASSGPSLNIIKMSALKGDRAGSNFIYNRGDGTLAMDSLMMAAVETDIACYQNYLLLYQSVMKALYDAVENAAAGIGGKEKSQTLSKWDNALRPLIDHEMAIVQAYKAEVSTQMQSMSDYVNWVIKTHSSFTDTINAGIDVIMKAGSLLAGIPMLWMNEIFAKAYNAIINAVFATADSIKDVAMTSYQYLWSPFAKGRIYADRRMPTDYFLPEQPPRLAVTDLSDVREKSKAKHTGKIILPTILPDMEDDSNFFNTPIATSNNSPYMFLKQIMATSEVRHLKPLKAYASIDSKTGRGNSFNNDIAKKFGYNPATSEGRFKTVLRSSLEMSFVRDKLFMQGYLHKPYEEAPGEMFPLSNSKMYMNNFPKVNDVLDKLNSQAVVRNILVAVQQALYSARNNAVRQITGISAGSNILDSVVQMVEAYNGAQSNAFDSLIEEYGTMINAHNDLKMAQFNFAFEMTLNSLTLASSLLTGFIARKALKIAGKGLDPDNTLEYVKKVQNAASRASIAVGAAKLMAGLSMVGAFRGSDAFNKNFFADEDDDEEENEDDKEAKKRGDNDYKATTGAFGKQKVSRAQLSKKKQNIKRQFREKQVQNEALAAIAGAMADVSDEISGNTSSRAGIQGIQKTVKSFEQVATKKTENAFKMKKAIADAQNRGLEVVQQATTQLATSAIKSITTHLQDKIEKKKKKNNDKAKAKKVADQKGKKEDKKATREKGSKAEMSMLNNASTALKLIEAVGPEVVVMMVMAGIMGPDAYSFPEHLKDKMMVDTIEGNEDGGDGEEGGGDEDSDSGFADTDALEASMLQSDISRAAAESGIEEIQSAAQFYNKMGKGIGKALSSGQKEKTREKLKTAGIRSVEDQLIGVDTKAPSAKSALKTIFAGSNLGKAAKGVGKGLAFIGDKSGINKGIKNIDDRLGVSKGVGQVGSSVSSLANTVKDVTGVSGALRRRRIRNAEKSLGSRIGSSGQNATAGERLQQKIKDKTNAALDQRQALLNKQQEGAGNMTAKDKMELMKELRNKGEGTIETNSEGKAVLKTKSGEEISEASGLLDRVQSNLDRTRDKFNKGTGKFDALRATRNEIMAKRENEAIEMMQAGDVEGAKKIAGDLNIARDTQQGADFEENMIEMSQSAAGESDPEAKKDIQSQMMSLAQNRMKTKIQRDDRIGTEDLMVQGLSYEQSVESLRELSAKGVVAPTLAGDFKVNEKEFDAQRNDSKTGEPANVVNTVGDSDSKPELNLAVERAIKHQAPPKAEEPEVAITAPTPSPAGPDTGGGSDGGGDGGGGQDSEPAAPPPPADGLPPGAGSTVQDDGKMAAELKSLKTSISKKRRAIGKNKSRARKIDVKLDENKQKREEIKRGSEAAKKKDRDADKELEEVAKGEEKLANFEQLSPDEIADKVPNIIGKKRNELMAKAREEKIEANKKESDRIRAEIQQNFNDDALAEKNVGDVKFGDFSDSEKLALKAKLREKMGAPNVTAVRARTKERESLEIEKKNIEAKLREMNASKTKKAPTKTFDRRVDAYVESIKQSMGDDNRTLSNDQEKMIRKKLNDQRSKRGDGARFNQAMGDLHQLNLFGQTRVGTKVNVDAAQKVKDAFYKAEKAAQLSKVGQPSAKVFTIGDKNSMNRKLNTINSKITKIDSLAEQQKASDKDLSLEEFNIIKKNPEFSDAFSKKQEQKKNDYKNTDEFKSKKAGAIANNFLARTKNLKIGLSADDIKDVNAQIEAFKQSPEVKQAALAAHLGQDPSTFKTELERKKKAAKDRKSTASSDLSKISLKMDSLDSDDKSLIERQKSFRREAKEARKEFDHLLIQQKDVTKQQAALQNAMQAEENALPAPPPPGDGAGSNATVQEIPTPEPAPGPEPAKDPGLASLMGDGVPQKRPDMSLIDDVMARLRQIKENAKLLKSIHEQEEKNLKNMFKQNADNNTKISSFLEKIHSGKMLNSTELNEMKSMLDPDKADSANQSDAEFTAKISRMVDLSREKKRSDKREERAEDFAKRAVQTRRNEIQSKLKSESFMTQIELVGTLLTDMKDERVFSANPKDMFEGAPMNQEVFSQLQGNQSPGQIPVDPLLLPDNQIRPDQVLTDRGAQDLAILTNRDDSDPDGVTEQVLGSASDFEQSAPAVVQSGLVRPGRSAQQSEIGAPNSMDDPTDRLATRRKAFFRGDLNEQKKQRLTDRLKTGIGKEFDDEMRDLEEVMMMGAAVSSDIQGLLKAVQDDRKTGAGDVMRSQGIEIANTMRSQGFNEDSFSQGFMSGMRGLVFGSYDTSLSSEADRKALKTAYKNDVNRGAVARNFEDIMEDLFGESGNENAALPRDVQSRAAEFSSRYDQSRSALKTQDVLFQKDSNRSMGVVMDALSLESNPGAQDPTRFDPSRSKDLKEGMLDTQNEMAAELAGMMEAGQSDKAAAILLEVAASGEGGRELAALVMKEMERFENRVQSGDGSRLSRMFGQGLNRDDYNITDKFTQLNDQMMDQVRQDPSKLGAFTGLQDQIAQTDLNNRFSFVSNINDLTRDRSLQFGMKTSGAVGRLLAGFGGGVVQGAMQGGQQVAEFSALMPMSKKSQARNQEAADMLVESFRDDARFDFDTDNGRDQNLDDLKTMVQEQGLSTAVREKFETYLKEENANAGEVTGPDHDNFFHDNMGILNEQARNNRFFGDKQDTFNQAAGRTYSQRAQQGMTLFAGAVAILPAAILTGLYRGAVNVGQGFREELGFGLADQDYTEDFDTSLAQLKGVFTSDSSVSDGSEDRSVRSVSESFRGDSNILNSEDIEIQLPDVPTGKTSLMDIEFLKGTNGGVSDSVLREAAIPKDANDRPLQESFEFSRRLMKHTLRDLEDQTQRNRTMLRIENDVVGFVEQVDATNVEESVLVVAEVLKGSLPNEEKMKLVQMVNDKVAKINTRRDNKNENTFIEQLREVRQIQNADIEQRQEAGLELTSEDRQMNEFLDKNFSDIQETDFRDLQNLGIDGREVTADELRFLTDLEIDKVLDTFVLDALKQTDNAQQFLEDEGTREDLARLLAAGLAVNSPRAEVLLQTVFERMEGRRIRKDMAVQLNEQIIQTNQKLRTKQIQFKEVVDRVEKKSVLKKEKFAELHETGYSAQQFLPFDVQRQGQPPQPINNTTDTRTQSVDAINAELTTQATSDPVAAAFLLSELNRVNDVPRNNDELEAYDRLQDSMSNNDLSRMGSELQTLYARMDVMGNQSPTGVDLTQMKDTLKKAIVRNRMLQNQFHTTQQRAFAENTLGTVDQKVFQEFESGAMGGAAGPKGRQLESFTARLDQLDQESPMHTIMTQLKSGQKNQAQASLLQLGGASIQQQILADRPDDLNEVLAQLPTETSVDMRDALAVLTALDAQIDLMPDLTTGQKTQLHLSIKDRFDSLEKLINDSDDQSLKDDLVDPGSDESSFNAVKTQSLKAEWLQSIAGSSETLEGDASEGSGSDAIEVSDSGSSDELASVSSQASDGESSDGSDGGSSEPSEMVEGELSGTPSVVKQIIEFAARQTTAGGQIAAETRDLLNEALRNEVDPDELADNWQGIQNQLPQGSLLQESLNTLIEAESAVAARNQEIEGLTGPPERGWITSESSDHIFDRFQELVTKKASPAQIKTFMTNLATSPTGFQSFSERLESDIRLKQQGPLSLKESKQLSSQLNTLSKVKLENAQEQEQGLSQIREAARKVADQAQAGLPIDQSVNVLAYRMEMSKTKLMAMSTGLTEQDETAFDEAVNIGDKSSEQALSGLLKALDTVHDKINTAMHAPAKEIIKTARSQSANAAVALTLLDADIDINSTSLLDSGKTVGHMDADGAKKLATHLKNPKTMARFGQILGKVMDGNVVTRTWQNTGLYNPSEQMPFLMAMLDQAPEKMGEMLDTIPEDGRGKFLRDARKVVGDLGVARAIGTLNLGQDGMEAVVAQAFDTQLGDSFVMSTVYHQLSDAPIAQQAIFSKMRTPLIPLADMADRTVDQLANEIALQPSESTNIQLMQVKDPDQMATLLTAMMQSDASMDNVTYLLSSSEQLGTFHSLMSERPQLTDAVSRRLMADTTLTPATRRRLMSSPYVEMNMTKRVGQMLRKGPANVMNVPSNMLAKHIKLNPDQLSNLDSKSLTGVVKHLANQSDLPDVLPELMALPDNRGTQALKKCMGDSNEFDADTIQLFNQCASHPQAFNELSGHVKALNTETWIGDSRNTTFVKTVMDNPAFLSNAPNREALFTQLGQDFKDEIDSLSGQYNFMVFSSAYQTQSPMMQSEPVGDIVPRRATPAPISSDRIRQDINLVLSDRVMSFDTYQDPIAMNGLMQGLEDHVRQTGSLDLSTAQSMERVLEEAQVMVDRNVGGNELAMQLDSLKQAITKSVADPISLPISCLDSDAIGKLSHANFKSMLDKESRPSQKMQAVATRARSGDAQLNALLGSPRELVALFPNDTTYNDMTSSEKLSMQSTIETILDRTNTGSPAYQNVLTFFKKSDSREGIRRQMIGNMMRNTRPSSTSQTFLGSLALSDPQLTSQLALQTLTDMTSSQQSVDATVQFLSQLAHPDESIQSAPILNAFYKNFDQMQELTPDMIRDNLLTESGKKPGEIPGLLSDLEGAGVLVLSEDNQTYSFNESKLTDDMANRLGSPLKDVFGSPALKRFAAAKGKYPSLTNARNQYGLNRVLKNTGTLATVPRKNPQLLRDVLDLADPTSDALETLPGSYSTFSGFNATISDRLQNMNYEQATQLVTDELKTTVTTFEKAEYLMNLANKLNKQPINLARLGATKVLFQEAYSLDQVDAHRPMNKGADVFIESLRGSDYFTLGEMAEDDSVFEALRGHILQDGGIGTHTQHFLETYVKDEHRQRLDIVTTDLDGFSYDPSQSIMHADTLFNADMGNQPIFMTKEGQAALQSKALDASNALEQREDESDNAFETRKKDEYTSIMNSAPKDTISSFMNRNAKRFYSDMGGKLAELRAERRTIMNGFLEESKQKFEENNIPEAFTNYMTFSRMTGLEMDNGGHHDMKPVTPQGIAEARSELFKTLKAAKRDGQNVRDTMKEAVKSQFKGDDGAVDGNVFFVAKHLEGMGEVDEWFWKDVATELGDDSELDISSLPDWLRNEFSDEGGVSEVTLLDNDGDIEQVGEVPFPDNDGDIEQVGESIVSGDAEPFNEDNVSTTDSITDANVMPEFSSIGGLETTSIEGDELSIPSQSLSEFSGADLLTTFMSRTGTSGATDDNQEPSPSTRPPVRRSGRGGSRRDAATGPIRNSRSRRGNVQVESSNASSSAESQEGIGSSPDQSSTGSPVRPSRRGPVRGAPRIPNQRRGAYRPGSDAA